jgi:hypothetical protein
VGYGITRWSIPNSTDYEYNIELTIEDEIEDAQSQQINWYHESKNIRHE